MKKPTPTRTSFASLAVVLLIVLAAIGNRLYVHHLAVETSPTVADIGAYPYHCSDGEAFTLYQNEDLSLLRIAPSAGAPLLPDATLRRASLATSSYEGGGLTLVGNGETLTLSLKSLTLTCTPLPDGDSAPLNFGD